MGVSSDQLKGSKYGYDYCVLGMKIYESKSWRQIDHGDDNACNYGIGVGVLTMLAVIAFIVLDILILRGIGAIGNKAFFNVADLVSSSILALRWLVGFIYILDKWDDSGPKDITIRYYFGPSNYDDIFKLDDKESAVGAAIAFCFFGAIIWVFTTIMDMIPF